MSKSIQGFWKAVFSATQACPPNPALQRSGEIEAFLAIRSDKKLFRSIGVVHSRRPLNAKTLDGSH
jgi:hypothetical protein